MSDYQTQRELETLRRKAAEYDDQRRYFRWGMWAIVLIVVMSLGGCFGYKAANPKLNLYKSNTEKQAVIKEQEAISEAEVFAAEKRVVAAQAEAEAKLIDANAEAERRVIEAKSIAESQEIIAATLTPEYLKWRFYEVLAENESDVIYVPTESGLPITEAGRATVVESEGGDD